MFSEMNLTLSEVNGPGDWALRISEALGAEEYVNPKGGAGLFDVEEFTNANISLTIRDFPNMEYNCQGYQFEPGLSIIDMMMWNSPAEIRAYLDDQKPEAVS